MGYADTPGMTATTRTQTSPLPARPLDDSLIEVARILTLILGVIAVVSALEISVVGLTGLFLVGPAMLLAAGWAMLLLLAARGIGRRSRRARKIALTAMLAMVVWALLDMALAIFLARRGLEIVPLLTRIVIPVAVWRILRRPWVRAEFGAKQSRRYRRKAARAS